MPHIPHTYYYLFIDLGSVLIPFLAGFHPRFKFQKQWKALFPAILLTMLLFIPWDIYKTSVGVWGFNPNYLTGYYLSNLPLEEWLFFITIPYACMFIYHVINKPFDSPGTINFFSKVSLVLSLVFVAVAILFINRTYTFVVFAATGIALFLIGYLWKRPFLGRFYLMYAISCLPFAVVNGLLTGSWIEGEIVWYNNAHNLGIRLGTIPIEDLVYSMMMLLSNIFWFEMFKGKYIKAN